MKIRWFGQSAFLIQDGDAALAIDPYRDLNNRGPWHYPPIEGASADLLLITHEHTDHSGAEFIGGEPQTIRSTTGRFESPFGEVVGIAAEHDDVAGTERGPMTIFCFTVGGVRFCHLGDFGQTALRPEQRQAIGDVDVLMIPVGGGSTLDGPAAAAIARELEPTVIVPMHYQTAGVPHFGPLDPFLEEMRDWRVERLDSGEFELDGVGERRIVVPKPPI
jgi:L-ascorbate metabolism protein UlaG (beta-lactamase superfamily)